MYRKDLEKSSYLLIEQHHIVQRLPESILMKIRIPSEWNIFLLDSPEFNAVEECWRQGKYHILSTYYPLFDFLKDTISYYYRTTRFNLDIVKYLMRTID